MKITRICLLLAALYLLALLSWNASAAETVTGGTINDAISWNFQNGTLSISGEGSMGFRPSQQSPWYHLREAITTVVVEEGVTVIGDNAFKNCIHLVQVQLPSTLRTIARGVFWDCPSIEEISIPAGVTTIGEYAFFYCTALKHVYNHAPEPQPVSVIFKRPDITVHVPAASVEKYRRANHWKEMNIVGDL